MEDQDSKEVSREFEKEYLEAKSRIVNLFEQLSGDELNHVYKAYENDLALMSIIWADLAIDLPAVLLLSPTRVHKLLMSVYAAGYKACEQKCEEENLKKLVNKEVQ